MDIKLKIPFLNKLSTTILFSFLALSLMPMILVTIIGYQYTYHELLDDAAIFLKTVEIEKKQKLEGYFHAILTDLKMQSGMESNTRMMIELNKGLGNSKGNVSQFIQGFEWAKVVDRHAFDINRFRKTYGYRDIFFIDKKGNILYSVARDFDLGFNLFKDEFDETHFSFACKKALKTGQPVFSDYDRYPASGNQVVGFMAAPILDDRGYKIGCIAFQFSPDHLNNTIIMDSILGNTVQTYLIGNDLKLRTSLKNNPDLKILETKIETDQSEHWKEHLNPKYEKEQKDDDAHKKEKDEILQHQAFVYKGPGGIDVLGIHEAINIMGISYGLISEIAKNEAFSSIIRFRNLIWFSIGITACIVFFLSVIISRRIVHPITILSKGAQTISQGDYTKSIEVATKNEIGNLAEIFNKMTRSLQKTKQLNEFQNWIKTGQNQLSDQMLGQNKLTDLGNQIITFLATYLNAHAGAIYIVEKNQKLKLFGTYAYQDIDSVADVLEFGQGMTGQAVKEKKSILLENIPENYMTISSGLGKTLPKQVAIIPLLHGESVKGAIELAALEPFSQRVIRFLELVSENIAISIDSIQARAQEQVLLGQTQKQHEELKTQQVEMEAQQRELKTANEKLEAQAIVLKDSEAYLKEQQEELRQTNEELNKQAVELELQAEQLESQKADIEEKAKAIETASKYKSEFLANMSHELRTPLNSILLLSRLLSDNKKNNLDIKQVEFSDTIHSSGTQLLNLINEILDLSKVESGKVELYPENTNIFNIVSFLEKNFEPLAKDKGIDFSIHLDKDLSETMYTDRQRLDQILRNLVSNAVKFTEKGSVRVDIRQADDDSDLSTLTFEKAILFKITDTGIGISKEQLKTVFEAFQQADGTTNRKFGGTGLGLSISRELAKLLGGQILVTSESGKGSVFSLYLPIGSDAVGIDKDRGKKEDIETLEFKEHPDAVMQKDHTVLNKNIELEKEFIPDDRKIIKPESKSILVIEDDAKFASILCDMAREKGFQVLAAENGETGLHFADYYQPKGILLDIGLPGMDGWTVMSRLKENLKTQHIPVHFISGLDENIDAMKMGAVGYLTKPISMDLLDRAFNKIDRIISSSVKNLLVVEDDKAQQIAIAEIVGNSDVKITKAYTGEEAIKVLSSKRFDCMILDHGLPDMTGAQLLSKIRKDNDHFQLPIIVYTGKELTNKEKTMFDEYSESIIIKGVGTYEKLFAETTLFLHRVTENLPADKQNLLRMTHDKESIFKDKKILIVDDDMRNVFALTSILEDKGMEILVGKNGREGIEVLSANPDTKLILMDIMMPEMDGYETIIEIRKENRFKQLPIIALTAKAMRGDRAKCIEAGASDYLSKPVNTDKLLSMMRVWLY